MPTANLIVVIWAFVLLAVSVASHISAVALYETYMVAEILKQKIYFYQHFFSIPFK